MSFPFAGMQGFQEYLTTVDPVLMQSELPKWPADPTDMLAFADIARSFGQMEHALVFYRYGLDEIEKDPSKVSKDTNLTGANFFFGKTLLQTNRAAESIRPLRAAADLNPQDAVTWKTLAMAYIFTSRLDVAHGCLERALNLEGIDKQQGPDFFQNVRNTLTELQGEIDRQKG